jgi:AraC-like DNA-binding protein
MRPVDLAPKVFSTVGLPAARRVELWETHNATALIALDVNTTESLDATEINVQLPRIHLARVAGSAHVVNRSAAVIKRSPANSVAVYLTLRGDAWFEDEEGSRALRPGNVLISEADRPFARGFRRGLEELVVKADHAALPQVAWLSKPVIASFGNDGPGNQYARALARAAARATRPGCHPPADEGAVLDLIAVLAGGRAVAPATAHRAAARSHIEEHLTSPDLGAEQVAAAIGISERQLSRVFAADGTTVPRYILSRRLHLAYAILSGAPAARRDDTETVADIAVRCGFTSVTYFSHAFLARFGQRASDIRREAQAPKNAELVP